jgi:hypothetical protein
VHSTADESSLLCSNEPLRTSALDQLQELIARGGTASIAPLLGLACFCAALGLVSVLGLISLVAESVAEGTFTRKSYGNGSRGPLADCPPTPHIDDLPNAVIDVGDT